MQQTPLKKTPFDFKVWIRAAADDSSIEVYGQNILDTCNAAWAFIVNARLTGSIYVSAQGTTRLIGTYNPQKEGQFVDKRFIDPEGIYGRRN
jgi:hypothetical protein